VTQTLRRRFGAGEPHLWVQRASRSSVSVPLAYRRVAFDDWFRGELINISRSGALFVADDALVPELDAAIVVFLSRAARSEIGASGRWPAGYSRGTIARIEHLTDGRYAIAVRFDAEWTPTPPDAEQPEPEPPDVPN
jgi:hypothetical protein